MSVVPIRFRMTPLSFLYHPRLNIHMSLVYIWLVYIQYWVHNFVVSMNMCICNCVRECVCACIFVVCNNYILWSMCEHIKTHMYTPMKMCNTTTHTDTSKSKCIHTDPARYSNGYCVSCVAYLGYGVHLMPEMSMNLEILCRGVWVQWTRIRRELH